MTTRKKPTPKTKKTPKTKTTKWRWDYETDLEPEEFLRRLAPLVRGPVLTLMECEGDMWMSDYNKLTSAYYRIHNAIEALDRGSAKG